MSVLAGFAFRGGAVSLGGKRCVLLGNAGAELARRLGRLGQIAEPAAFAMLETPEPARLIVFPQPALPHGGAPWLQPIDAFEAFKRLHRHAVSPDLQAYPEGEGMFLGRIAAAAHDASFAILALPPVASAEADAQALAVAALLA